MNPAANQRELRARPNKRAEPANPEKKASPSKVAKVNGDRDSKGKTVTAVSPEMKPLKQATLLEPTPKTVPAAEAVTPSAVPQKALHSREMQPVLKSNSRRKPSS